MEPVGVTLDEATARKLSAVNGTPIPLRNPAGQVIGYYLTPAAMEKQRLGWQPGMGPSWTDEEIARAIERSKNDPRPKRTMEEVLRMVEGT